MGGTQQRESTLSPAPWLPPCDHDPEEDPAGPAGPWPEGSSGKLRPTGKPPQTPSQGPGSSDHGEPVPLVGVGLLGGADWGG